jgi:hypothetical protein
MINALSPLRFGLNEDRHSLTNFVLLIPLLRHTHDAVAMQPHDEGADQSQAHPASSSPAHHPMEHPMTDRAKGDCLGSLTL